jgi:hypothetical protein
VRGLDVEQLADQRADHGPLIKTKAVDDHQQRLPVRLEGGPKELGANVDRERGAVAAPIAEPAGVAPLQELGEVLPQAFLERAQGILQSRLIGLAQPHFPFGQLDHELDPLAPAERGAAAGLKLAEAGREVAREALLPDPITLE